jgi:hypothetical protein
MLSLLTEAAHFDGDKERGSFKAIQTSNHFSNPIYLVNCFVENCYVDDMSSKTSFVHVSDQCFRQGDRMRL